MADGVTVKLEGVDALIKALAEATKQIRTKAVRSALRKAAVVIQKQAKLNTPVLSAPTKTRKPGTVKNAITVRVSKAARKDGNEGVFVSVRPLKSAQIRKFKQSQAKRGANASGSKNPNDPYYWRFAEFGTKKQQATPFLAPALESHKEAAIDAMRERLQRELDKAGKA